MTAEGCSRWLVLIGVAVFSFVGGALFAGSLGCQSGQAHVLLNTFAVGSTGLSVSAALAEEAPTPGRVPVDESQEPRIVASSTPTPFLGASGAATLQSSLDELHHSERASSITQALSPAVPAIPSVQSPSPPPEVPAAQTQEPVSQSSNSQKQKKQQQKNKNKNDEVIFPREQGLRSKLWDPPKLCKGKERPFPKGTAATYPGLNFCPPLQVDYLRDTLRRFSPPRPTDFWMLDAPAILALIATKEQMSMYLVNLGAAPMATGEDENRTSVKMGDHCTPLWWMGYRGMNFDPRFQNSGRKRLKGFLDALTDEHAYSPEEFPLKLKEFGVPQDLDMLKIDTDSFDGEFLNRTLHAGFRPKLIVIELSSWWPPPLKFMLRFEGNSAPNAPYLIGCSLQMAVEMVKPFGYTLIQYPLEDGWFVRNEDLHLFGHLERDTRQLFLAGNPNFYVGNGGFIDYTPRETLRKSFDDPIAMLEKARSILKHWREVRLTTPTNDAVYDLGL